MRGEDDDSPCPDDVVLAAFAEGTLDTATRRKMVRHLADCFECASVVGDTVRLLESERANEAPERPWWRASRLLAVTAIFALLAVAGVVWRSLRRDELRGIRSAMLLAPVRPVEGQLAGFPYAEFPEVRSASTPPALPLELRAEAESVQSRRGNDAETLRARGIAILLMGRPAEGVRLLNAATRGAPDVAAYWNDLAVAEIAWAAATREPTRLRDAVAAADRALALSPQTAEAQFNRAVALDHLGERDAARQSYHRAIADEPNSLWAAEVRLRLERLAAETR